jgi:hypothetical protein
MINEAYLTEGIAISEIGIMGGEKIILLLRNGEK